MNNERRKEIAAIVKQLQELPCISDIKEELESIKDAEQEAYDNSPESLQNGERGERMQEAISNMESALEALDFDVDDIIANLETAAE